MKEVLLAFVLFALVSLYPIADAADEICDTQNLVSALEELYDLDQEPRIGLAPNNDIWNRERLQQIVGKCGWPNIDVVGRKAALGAFLVLQHAPLDLQLQYMPLLREAARDRQLAPGTLPLLEDRILVRKGLPQQYGTQFSSGCELHEIADPDTIGERREAAGLPPLAAYVAHCARRKSGL